MAKAAIPVPSFSSYPIPEFDLPCSDGTRVSAASLKGQWSVIFIYPADNTPTCTTEAVAFTEMSGEFADRGVRLFGLSPDSLKDHDKFISKHSLTVPLLSDEGAVAINAFGSWGEKMLYGRHYMGTDRSTFIVDPHGLVRHAWRRVRVKDHVSQVLQTLDTLMS